MLPDLAVSSIMTTRVHVATVGQRPSEVRQLLVDLGVHHLPVVRDGSLVGLVSSTDMFKLSMASYGADLRAVDAFLDHQFTIEDIMKTQLETIGPEESVRVAAQKLAHGRFHSLPVVDAGGTLVGIVTSTDLIRYLLSLY